MKQFVVRAIKIGSGFTVTGGIAKKIIVPAESEAEARRKAEIRLGANWGVYAAVEVVPTGLSKKDWRRIG